MKKLSGLILLALFLCPVGCTTDIKSQLDSLEDYADRLTEEIKTVRSQVEGIATPLMVIDSLADSGDIELPEDLAVAINGATEIAEYVIGHIDSIGEFAEEARKKIKAVNEKVPEKFSWSGLLGLIIPLITGGRRTG